MKKKICIVSIMRNEKWFLPLWYNYYVQHIPKEDIYIIAMNNTDNSLDGVEANIIEFNTGFFSAKTQNDKLSETRKELHEKYEWVLFADADEFIVPDPEIHPKGLRGYIEYLDQNDTKTMKATGYNIIQDMDHEEKLDVNKPILQQRKYWWRNTSFDKACISSTYVNLALGYHICLDSAQKDANLYFLHLHHIDYDILYDRVREWTNSNIKERRRSTGKNNRISLDKAESHLRSFFEKTKNKRILDRLKIF